MTVKMILAVDRGNAIGWEDGRLPWKIPADMKRFKELTSGHHVLMGRKTFESLGRPQGLPNRTNYVTSYRNHDSIVECDTVAIAKTSVDGAFNPTTWVGAHQACLGCKPEDLWVIGGATLYTQFIQLKLVDEIHLTLVDVNSEADVKLPFDLANWKLFILHQAKDGVQWNLEQISPPQKTDEGITFTFLTLKRIK